MPPPTPPSAAEIEALIAEADLRTAGRYDYISGSNREFIAKLTAALRAQSDELRELRHDKGRLDWLDAKRLFWQTEGEPFSLTGWNRPQKDGAYSNTARHCIDAARTSAGREGEGM